MEEGDEDKDTKVDGREKKVTRILAMTHVPADTDAAYWLTGLWTRGSNLALSRILAIRMRGEFIASLPQYKMIFVSTFINSVEKGSVMTEEY
uniref:Uncharacterized protein n=2 Tax=Oryza glumipatula TaxID=40148 RepID=A0A0D9ZRM6_9ORYZ